MPDTQSERPIEYRDRQHRVWRVAEVARVRVVSASIDGPNHFLVIRFERESDERFAHRIGGDDWIQRSALHRLFVEAEPAEGSEGREGSETKPSPVANQPNTTSDAPNDTQDTGVGPAPRETVDIWVKLVATMGPDELADFGERTFRQWDPASLGGLRGAIQRRRQQRGDA